MAAPEAPRRLPSRRMLNAVAFVILALVLFFTWRAVPRVPRRVSILAGPNGTSHFEYAERYATYLRKKGLAAEVVETRGSLENLERLAAELDKSTETIDEYTTVVHDSDINSTSLFSGCSAATPNAAGVAGLLRSLDPTLTQAQIVNGFGARSISGSST